MASTPTRANRRATPATPAAPAHPVLFWKGAGPRYWVCLVLLGLAVVGLESLSRWAGWVLRKEAVPLQRPLAVFDGRKLGPRFGLNRDLTDRIATMSEDTIESLGTREFLQVYITDGDKLPHDPTRHARVFVTYYTGRPDMVPHVPDECYLAGGYRKISEATVEIPVRGVGAAADQVPVRVLEFEAPRHGLGTAQVDKTTVLYFFHANGGYATTRNGVRRILSDPRVRHAYYAKVEITYTDGFSSRADKTASLEAAGPLLERFLPVLFEDHFDLTPFGPSAADDGGPRVPAAPAALSVGRSGVPPVPGGGRGPK